MILARPFLATAWRSASLRRTAIICIGLALLASAAEIAVALALLPIMSSLGIDAGEEIGEIAGQFTPLAWLALFTVAMILRSIVSWQSSIQDYRGSYDLTVSLQTRLYRALSAAHWDAIRRVSPPRLTNALQTQAHLAGDGFSSLVQVVSAGFLIVGYIVSAAFVFPLILPPVFVVLVLMWRLNTHRSGQILQFSEDYHEAQTDLHQRYEDWVAISRIASLGVNSTKLADRFETEARGAIAHAVNVSHSSALTRISYDAAVAVAVVIGVPIAWKLETPPALLAFGLLLLVRVLPRIAGVHGGYHGMINAVAPVQAVVNLAEALEADPAIHSTALAPLDWQQLELSNIGVRNTMRGTDQGWILRDVDLTMRPGEWLAFTGPTGAGKTTLADVILTLVRPDSGSIQIDGHDLNKGLASRWRNQAAYVPQDVVLFDASIRNNLKLYAPDATDEQLEVALRQSAAEFVMERLPEGLDTQVGPGGRWLSGGECQRIGIARALLRKPGLIVLDEPTAALDEPTQTRLMAALGELEHTMSLVLITHRPELLQLADKIIGIEDGAITRRDDGFRRSDPVPPNP